MAGLTAQGAAFSFAGFSGAITGLNVESPVAELVDFTSVSDRADIIKLVPTGAWSGGSVTVDYISNGLSPTPLVRTRGQLQFLLPNFRVSMNAVVESASITVQTGDLVRGTIRFRPTDYYGVI